MASDTQDDEYGNPGQGGGGTAGTGGGGVQGSAAARKYYNSFPPDMQEKIRTSTGGNLDQWFQNAVSAGAVSPTGDRNAGEQTSDTSGKGGGWTPERIRQHFKSMPSSTSGTGYNDTFDNIDDNTLWTWINKGLWDPNRKVFKNEADPSLEIDYTKQPDFKPTDCPAGMTPLGTGGKCVPNEQFDPKTGAFIGGGPKAGAAAGQGASYYGQDDPLQRYLTGLLSTGGGAFGGAATGGPYGGATRNAGAQLQGGGVMWTGGPATPTTPAVQTGGAEARPAATGATTQVASAYGGINPAANLPASTAVAPAAAPVANFSAQPAAGANSNPWGTVTGVQTADPLAGLVDPRAKRKDARAGGSWF